MASHDAQAKSFWKGELYVQVMMTNVAGANNIMEHDLRQGRDPQGQQWQ